MLKLKHCKKIKYVSKGFIDCILISLHKEYNFTTNKVYCSQLNVKNILYKNV